MANKTKIVELGEEVIRRLRSMGEPEDDGDGKGWIIDSFLDLTEGSTDIGFIHLYQSDFEELVRLARLGMKYEEEHRDDHYDGLS